MTIRFPCTTLLRAQCPGRKGRGVGQVPEVQGPGRDSVVGRGRRGARCSACRSRRGDPGPAGRASRPLAFDNAQAAGYREADGTDSTGPYEICPFCGCPGHADGSRLPGGAGFWGRPYSPTSSAAAASGAYNGKTGASRTIRAISLIYVGISVGAGNIL